MASPTSTTSTTTSTWTAPTGYAALIAISQGQAAGMHAFPKGFIPPSFFEGYVPENRQSEILIVCVVSMSITLVVAIARLVTRRIVSGWLGMDDWMIIPATLFAAGLTVNNICTAYVGGLGKHGWDVTYKEAVEGTKLIIPHAVIYAIAIFFVKMSIIFFVQRLAGPHCKPGLRYTIYGYFAFHIAFALSCVFAYVFQCSPVASGFNLSLRLHPDSTCLDYGPFYYITSGIHVVSDVALLALPIWMVVGLQMSWQKKSAVVLMFCLGGVACICSMVRMVYIPKWTSSYEASWDGIDPTIWGQLEATISITTASLPSLKTLFGRVLPGLLSSAVRSEKERSGGGGGDTSDAEGTRSRTRDSLSDLFRRQSFQRRLSKPRRPSNTIPLESLTEVNTPPPPTTRMPGAAVLKDERFSFNSYVELVNTEKDMTRRPPGTPTREELELEQRSKDYRMTNDHTQWL